jgi:hypothetical protein
MTAFCTFIIGLAFAGCLDAAVHWLDARWTQRALDDLDRAVAADEAERERG